MGVDHPDRPRVSARAVLIDDADRLVLIKRTKIGLASYWTTPGGGVEASDVSVTAALHRELMEELGATAVIGPEVFVQPATATHPSVQHFFLAMLVAIDPTMRTDTDAEWDRRDVVRIPISQVDDIDLRPPELATVIAERGPSLAADARRLS